MEEVLSLLNKGAVETVQLSQDQGSTLFPLLIGYQAPWWVQPHRHPQWTQHVPPCFEVPHGDLNLIIQGLPQGWWMVLLNLRDTYLHVLSIHPSIGGTFGLLSGMQRGTSLSISGSASLLA